MVLTEYFTRMRAMGHESPWPHMSALSDPTCQGKGEGAWSGTDGIKLDPQTVGTKGQFEKLDP